MSPFFVRSFLIFLFLADLSICSQKLSTISRSAMQRSTVPASTYRNISPRKEHCEWIHDYWIDRSFTDRKQSRNIIYSLTSTKLTAVTYKGDKYTIDLGLLDFGAAYTAVLKEVSNILAFLPSKESYSPVIAIHHMTKHSWTPDHHILLDIPFQNHDCYYEVAPFPMASFIWL